MRKFVLFAAILMTGLLTVNQEVKGQTKVFDQTITWEHAPYDHGGYGFYWWHRTDGYSMVNYGDMPSDNWFSPTDYYNGNFTMSVEVISQPTGEPFYIQFGIWGDYYKGGSHTETVAGRQYVDGGAGSTGSWGLGSPADWWNKQAGDPLDFSRADDFYRIGVVLWDGANVCIPMGHEWSPAGCPENAYKYFPMTIRISVYASSGSGPPPPPPSETPSYTVDYIYEETFEAVVPEHEYSYDGSSYTTGSNDYVSLTPGQTTYFRVKTDPSKLQTLNVPARPSAPTFGIDYANERTSETVSSEYQYSSNSDMSSSTSGDGSYVSLTPGSSTYFRKSATGSAFASNIQELFMPSASTPDYSIDYWGERTNKEISSEDQFSYNSDFSGAEDGNGQYLYLTPGRNVYFRSKADYSKTQTLTVPYRPGTPSFEIDYINERTSSVVSSEYIYSSNSDMSSSSTGDGSYVNLSPGSNMYFRMSATGSAFASGTQTLTAPARPAAPAFAIDFVNGRTAVVVESTHEYAMSSDMSDATTGSGEYLAIGPESTHYFRTKASSSAFLSGIQTLIAPARPAAPSFQIDFMKEEISTAIGSGYSYSGNPDMSNASQGSDNVLALSPGVNMYFQEMASASAFASEIQMLESPARAAAPSVSIDYLNEKSAELIPAGIEYSGSAGFETVESGNGEALDLIPGVPVFFRNAASPSSYASEVYQLLVPGRPLVSSTESGSTELYPFMVDFTFHQEVALLDENSISVANAEVKNLSLKNPGDSESVYEGEVFATANDKISIMVPANIVQDGNFISDLYEISFTGLLPGVGVESLSLSSISVYPNPGKGVFHIKMDDFDASASYRVEVSSITGKVAHTETIHGPDNISMDLSGFADGIYMMRLLKNDQLSGTVKLIIK